MCKAVIRVEDVYVNNPNCVSLVVLVIDEANVEEKKGILKTEPKKMNEELLFSNQLPMLCVCT